MFQVFLDLSKAFDTVNQGKLLHLLKAYGLSTNISSILENFWNQLWVIPKQGGFYHKPIESRRGVIQEDPLSPTLFDVVMLLLMQWSAKQNKLCSSPIMIQFLRGRRPHDWSRM
jgi:Reverse transcriptase (RNA-dependent DNA polymerase)